jgi:redox-sensitive bicupin YhaK (pirin superfamily)
MKAYRNIARILKSRPTMEGAGVRLNRVFGYDEVPLLDPFLLLDDFHSDNPADYLKGFPWHPHRGIETMTYMISGSMKHEDSLGNKGTINGGDGQWMTAGSGIIHSEMPGQDSGLLWGLQLWVNLPSRLKMTDPRYRDITAATVPEISAGDASVKIIAGDFEGVKGPALEISAEPTYIDAAIRTGGRLELSMPRGRTAFAYVLEGDAIVSDGGYPLGPGTLALFSDGEAIQIRAGKTTTRLILVSGKPIGEPVAWQGPIVMNTKEELARAFEEYRNGTFLRHTMKK